MKNYTIKDKGKVWLQRKPNIIGEDIEEFEIKMKSKKKLNKRGGKGIKCPNCP